MRSIYYCILIAAFGMKKKEGAVLLPAMPSLSMYLLSSSEWLRPFTKIEGSMRSV
jgi:hypothetical protein